MLNHRRPSNDELTPDDLFRPEPPQSQHAGGNTIPGEVVRSTDMPWNTPAQPEYLGGTAPVPYQQQQYPPEQYQPEQYQPDPYQADAYQSAQYQQQPVEEASTQFMPPFPAEPQPPQQQGYGSYQPGYGAQPGYGQQPQPQQAGYGYQAAPPQAPPAGGARRFSPRAIAIAVVAACAVVGIAVGAALSGGGGGTAAAAGTGGPSASAGASQQAAGSGVNQAQAQALSDLLKSASNSRASVVAAVYNIQHCQNLDQAAQNLTTAAGMRGQLITQLGTVQTDGLPDGTELVAALKQGWTASQSADTHYAAWAKASAGSCAHKHQPKAGDEERAAGTASSNATVAKRTASRLWNAIAAKTGLPERAYTAL